MMGSGLIEAELGARKLKEDGRRDRAADALRQVWSGAQAMLVNQEWTDFLGGGTTTYTRIIIPVLVTNAHLWECRLGDDGQPVAVPADTFGCGVRPRVALS